ncbi:hypothetical protein [Pararhodobacter sp. SW119]|uniref:anti-sigma factor family protein n=1 Tax=Pararhodobacter sp. SW119 TaxID=2780075 RepID=UPI001AE01B2D|nr:hypothetical protein [Pararhodobacter sp. SW119]
MTQSEVSDEMLMALADGELPETQAGELQARMRRDPALAARYAVFSETRQKLKDSLDPGPIPDRLLRAILDTPVEPQTATNVTPLPRRAGWTGRAGGLALAATLLLAVGIGGYELGRRAGIGEVSEAAAVGAVAGVPTGGMVNLAGGGTARVLGSFDTDAGLCRLVAMAPVQGAGTRVVACRADENWQVLLSVASEDADAFVTASGTSVELVDDLLDRLGAGPALTPEAEAARLNSENAP